MLVDIGIGSTDSGTQVYPTVKLGHNEHSVITNRFISQIVYFSAQINLVITNNNERSLAVR